MEMMRPRSVSSFATAVLAVAISTVWAVIAGGVVVDAARLIDSSTESDSGLVGLFGTGFGAVGIALGAGMLALAAWGCAIGVIEWQRRPWIRIPGIATFATYGGFASLYLASALGSDSGVEAGRLVLAVASLVADFGLVLLLAARSSTAGRANSRPTGVRP